MAASFAGGRRRWILVAAAAAAGLSGYGFYRIHQLPSVSSKRRKLVKLFTSLFSVADAISSSADAVTLLSSDLNHFLRSDSDEIPSSLNQLFKIARSDEFSTSISRLSNALATGINSPAAAEAQTSSSFSDRLFSDKGAAFASAVSGSVARSIVMAFDCRGRGEAIDSWVDLMCADKCRELIQLFVRTAVSVYLEKTSYGKAAIQVHHLMSCCSDDMKRDDVGGWVEQVSSLLAVPSNRQFLLDVTGRVTFESVRSFLKFVMWYLHDGLKRSVNVVSEKAVETGMDVLRYLSAKAMFAFSLCIALCMGVAAGQRVLLAA